MNTRLKDVHEAALQLLEAHRQYATLQERLQDDEWIGIYLDLAQQQFWLDLVEGVRSLLPFMIAVGIYRRDLNKDAAELGNFFASQIHSPYRNWWAWATDSLTPTTSRHSSDAEVAGLQHLVQLAEQRSPTFPPLLPESRQELEALLWWRLGEAYRDSDKIKALIWYEKALTRLGTQSDLREVAGETAFERAYQLNEEKKYVECLPLLNRAIELKPDYVFAYNNRGIAYKSLKEYGRAIQDYDRAIALDPNDAAAYNNRGLAYLWLKNRQQAKADYHTSSLHNPADCNAAWMAEWAGMGKQRIGPKVAERLEAIAAIDPQHYVAHVCRGVALGTRGRLQEGLQELVKAISVKPEMWDAYFWKGMLAAYYYREPLRTDVAEHAIMQALEVGLPPILLTPLYWLEVDVPGAFVQYARPLLQKYGV